MSLTQTDLGALQRTLAAFQDCPDVKAFHRTALRVLPQLIPAEHFMWAEYAAIDPATRQAKLGAVRETVPRYVDGVIPQCERIIFEHPFTYFFVQTHDPSALIQSDFWTPEQFRASSLHELLEQTLHTRFMLSLPIFSCDAVAAALTFSRWENDFTERDRQLLNLMRPGFDAAHRDTQLRTAHRALQGRPLADYGLTPREAEIARWLAAGKQNPEMAIILDTNVRTIEKHMEHVLHKLGAENRTAAAVMLARSPDLTEASPARGRDGINAFQLTARESEIARWLAIGKTNQSIARKLRISDHTVEKHVEAIITKLGVENRTTAAVAIINSIERVGQRQLPE